MGYWVQYHSLRYNKGELPYSGSLGIETELDIVTDKNYAHDSKGGTIFLIVGIDTYEHSTEYLLWARFQCEGIQESTAGESKRWKVFGDGWILEDASGRKLNNTIGFPEFREFWRNGGKSLYFKEISNSPFVETLIDLSERYKPKDYPIELDDDISEDDEIDESIQTQRSISNSADRNKEVEVAAVKYVVSFMEEKGWRGRSVEKENLGYDYIFQKGREEIHVEIKGLSGKDLNFILTANEYITSKNDPKFHICIVTNALTNPKINFYTKDQFFKTFYIAATAYRVTLK